MSKDLNKKALADVVAEKTGITKKAANELVDVTFKTIIETLIDGGAVDIFGFGKFEVKERNARNGINPITKEKIEIAASKSPAFKASRLLKDAIKND